MSRLQISVRPAVKKYLLVHLGAEYDLSLSDPFGILLLQLLRRPLQDKRKAKTVAEYKEKFDFGTTGYPAQKWGLRSFTSGTVYLFSKYVHEVMMAEMYGQVATYFAAGHGLHDSIHEWMAIYGFSETDLTFDAVKKSYQRQRKEGRNKPVVVRQSPLKAVHQLKAQLLKLPIVMPASVARQVA